MRDLDVGDQMLVRGEDTLLKACQRDGGAAKPAELPGGDVALLLPERVDDADESGALPGKIA